MRRVSPWRFRTARTADTDPAELAADVNTAMGAELRGHLEDAPFEFRGRLVGHPGTWRRGCGAIPLAPYFSQVSFPPGGQADVVEFLRHSRPLNSSALVLMRRSVPSVVI